MTRTHFSEELLRLPTQAAVAARVLALAHDHAIPLREVATVVQTDPVLTARMLRLANSAHHGASRQVSSVDHAAVLLGEQSVRALAVSAASCHLDETPSAAPEGFWAHAVVTAVASAVIAERMGHARADGFSAGLLHDLGALLLHQRHPEHAARARRSSSTSRRLAQELRAFGCTHAQAGADALEAWSFPPELVHAVRDHHGAQDPVHALGRALRVGEALGRLVEPIGPARSPRVDRERAEWLLPSVGLAASTLSSLRDELLADLERTTAVLGVVA